MLVGKLNFPQSGNLFWASLWPQPGESLDLGRRSLDECRNVTVLTSALSENGSSRLSHLRTGHVYLMHAFNDERWILFRVDEIGALTP